MSLRSSLLEKKNYFQNIYALQIFSKEFLVVTGDILEERDDGYYSSAHITATPMTRFRVLLVVFKFGRKLVDKFSEIL